MQTEPKRIRIPKKDLTKWIKALRSGKYKQTKATLQDGDGFCCLGVACDITIPKKKRARKFDVDELAGEFPEDAQKFAPDWLKQVNGNVANLLGDTLSRMNDDGVVVVDSGPQVPLTFDEIADVLELVYVHKAVGT